MVRLKNILLVLFILIPLFSSHIKHNHGNGIGKQCISCLYSTPAGDCRGNSDNVFLTIEEEEKLLLPKDLKTTFFLEFTQKTRGPPNP